MTERSPYSLDSVQLEKAVQALQKAAETLRPKPNEERLYHFLGICVRVAVGAFASMALVGVMARVVAPKNGEAETALYDVFLISALVFVLLFFLAAIVALIFLLLNHSVIRQAFRQRRLLKKLGIREVSLSAWRLQRRGHRWSRLAGAVLTAGGILAFAVGLFGLIVMIVMSIYSKIEDIKGVAITGGIMYGLFFAFGVTLLIWRFVQRSREQWAIVADANRLRSALESMQTKAGAREAVAVPAAVVENAAQIERVSIARERRDAVVASAGTTDHGYGVLVARDLSSQKGLLDPQQRVAVEDLIENLSANPRPAGVEETPGGLLNVRTPKGDVGLQYSVDEGARRVHIVALTAHAHG
jgi:nitrate reductase gamma subunit/mRNA-degrading endonuclease RelE of RelBE toxin-antitoxin system